MAAGKRVLLVVKRSVYDIYVGKYCNHRIESLLKHSRDAEGLVVSNLISRHQAHTRALDFCQRLMTRMGLTWHSVGREMLPERVEGVDLVMTVGGDGTLLDASHHLDHTIPILGLNSDPAKLDKAHTPWSTFDAQRSTGHLCAATCADLEEVLEDVMTGTREPVPVTRMQMVVDGVPYPYPALNDVMLAHPCPAAASRCTFGVVEPQPDGLSRPAGPSTYIRSSGLRACTAIGSSAAMKSGGGFPMHLRSSDLQFRVREPILAEAADYQLVHGFVRPSETLRVVWGTRVGAAYVDGHHLCREVEIGDTIELSARAPVLQLHVPPRLL